MKTIVNLICLNSEPELPTLLESLKGKIDGLVAVDGGSTDNTVNILREWGVANEVQTIVKTNKWPDDFALQRNLCLNVTRAEFGMASPENDIWVLMIDSDDTLTAFDQAYLAKATATCDVTGLLCHMNNGITDSDFQVCQFFRLTPDAMWKNAIHEYIVSKGHKGLPPSQIPDGNGGMVGTLRIKRGRSAQHDRDPERNTRIGRKLVEAEPDNTRARFYLSRDLLECEQIPTQQRRAEAEGHLRAYLAMNAAFPAQDRYARLLLVRLLCDTGRVAEARRLLLDALESDPDNRSGYEALSRISEGKESAVWFRLSAAAEGACILPYGSRLPIAKGAPISAPQHQS